MVHIPAWSSRALCQEQDRWPPHVTQTGRMQLAGLQLDPLARLRMRTLDCTNQKSVFAHRNWYLPNGSHSFDLGLTEPAHNPV